MASELWSFIQPGFRHITDFQRWITFSSAVRWIAIAVIPFAIPQVARAHPLHNSLAQLTVDARTGAVSVSLRVFADDFTAAARNWSMKEPMRSKSAAFDYARASIVIRESGGRIVPLSSCGEKRSGDLMFVCLAGRISPNSSVSAVLSRVLTEKFDDQVNIVRASYSGRRVSLLFTAGDGEKRLPW